MSFKRTWLRNSLLTDYQTRNHKAMKPLVLFNVDITANPANFSLTAISAMRSGKEVVKKIQYPSLSLSNIDLAC